MNLVAPTIIGTLDFMVRSSFGAECGLTDFERGIMTPSMQRTLERMPAGAASKAAVFIDPLVLITCMMFWARRISKVKDQEAKEKYAIKPMEAARANGVSGTTFSVQSPVTGQQHVAETNNNRVPSAPPANGVSSADAAAYAAYSVPDSIRESFENDNI